MSPLVRSALLLVPALSLIAEQVPVRRVEGRLHGFLVIRDLDGKVLASGGLTQVASGNKVTAELSFHFKDGSVHDEAPGTMSSSLPR